MNCAFVATTVYFSVLTPARAAGEADAFTPQPQHFSRPSDRPSSGFFSGRSSNDASGPGKPDDFDSDSGCQMKEDSDISDTESEEDQCDQQNKAGINELPDSSKFIYNLRTKTARKAAKIAWKNSEARKEIISNLDKIDKGNLLPRNEKNFKGIKIHQNSNARTSR